MRCSACEKAVPVSHFVKIPHPPHLYAHAQVLLMLMGGLQSEALVVMVADPCPLWINKPAQITLAIAAGVPADRAWFWGKLLKRATTGVRNVWSWGGTWIQRLCGIAMVIWCLLFCLLVGTSPWLVAQVLHLQNRHVIVVSTTVISLPPSAQSALPCLCLFIPAWMKVQFRGVWFFFKSRLTYVFGQFVFCVHISKLLLNSRYCMLTVPLSLLGQWWSVLVRACSWGCLLQIRTTPLTGWVVTMRTMRANRSLTLAESAARQRLLYPPQHSHTRSHLTAAARWGIATVTGARSGGLQVGDLPPAAWRRGTTAMDCVKDKEIKQPPSKHWRGLAAPSRRRSVRNDSSFPTHQRKIRFSVVRWAALSLMSVFSQSWLTA